MAALVRDLDIGALKRRIALRGRLQKLVVPFLDFEASEDRVLHRIDAFLRIAVHLFASLCRCQRPEIDYRIRRKQVSCRRRDLRDADRAERDPDRTVEGIEIIASGLVGIVHQDRVGFGCAVVYRLQQPVLFAGMVCIIIHLPCGKLIDGVVFPCKIFDQEDRPFERPFAFRFREILIDSCPSCVLLRNLQRIVQRLVGKRHRRRLSGSEIHREDLVALIEAERCFRLFYVISTRDHLRVVRGAVGLRGHAADLICAGRVAEDAEHCSRKVITVVPVGDLRAFRGLPHLHLPGVDEGDRKVRLRAVRLDDQAVDLLAAAFLDQPVGGSGSLDVHGHDVRPQELRDVRRRFQMEGIALVQVRGIYRAVLQHEAHLGRKPAVGQALAGRDREGPRLLDIPIHHPIR